MPFQSAAEALLNFNELLAEKKTHGVSKADLENAIGLWLNFNFPTTIAPYIQMAISQLSYPLTTPTDPIFQKKQELSFLEQGIDKANSTVMILAELNSRMIASFGQKPPATMGILPENQVYLSGFYGVLTKNQPIPINAAIVQKRDELSGTHVPAFAVEHVRLKAEYKALKAERDKAEQQETRPTPVASTLGAPHMGPSKSLVGLIPPPDPNNGPILEEEEPSTSAKPSPGDSPKRK